MLEKIEKAFRDLISSMQMARLYNDWHPQFKKGIEKAYASIEDCLKEKDELVFGIIGEELAYEKEIFFELSKTTRPMILYLKDRGIEKMIFSRGFQKEELGKFIGFLVKPKEEIKHEPQEELSALGVKNITAGKIGVTVAPESSQKLERSLNYLSVYEDSLDKLDKSLETVLGEEEIDHITVKLAVTNVMENLLGRYQEFLNFATIKKHDLRTSFHIVNVAILSMYFSSKMGFLKEEILEIGVAALFHDIGKMYISKKIIQKPDKLTDEEYEEMKSHASIGAGILLKHVDSLGVLPVVVCFEHHMRDDLKGYPKAQFYNKRHIASSIVGICDVYDALSQKRGYKNDFPPEAIYQEMMKARGTVFEAELLDKFFKIMGVWPVGTLVFLSDSSVAVVREENEDDVYSPKVEVVAPPGKKEAIDLKTAKGALKIERSLNPLKEGKEYLSLLAAPQ